MLQDYADGEGSMATEAEKTAQSWEGSLNRLSNSWTKFIDTITNQDALIDGINLLSKFVSGVTDLTDKIGVLSTLSIGGGLFAGLKNIGRSKMLDLNKRADNISVLLDTIVFLCA